MEGVTYLMRILIVGNTDVGKTSLLVRFNEDKFVTNQRTTIGVDYKAREVEICGERVKMQIWDTAGQERFRSMTSAFYNKAQGVVLCFDVGQRNSFLSLPGWIDDIRRDAPEGCHIILCANKIDLAQKDWAVSQKEIQAFAAEQEMRVFETSGKTGANVPGLFVALGEDILAKGKDKLTQIKPEVPVDSMMTRGMSEASLLIDTRNRGGGGGGALGAQPKEKSKCC